MKLKSSFLNALAISLIFSNTALATNKTSPRWRPISIHFTLIGQVTPTSDPCYAHTKEVGTASSAQLGEFEWAGEAVDNYCSRGLNKGNHVAISTFTAPDGDKIFATYQTPFDVNGYTISWKGTWEFLGGTGKYATIKGKGTIPLGGIPDFRFASTVPYNCHFDGFYKY